MGNDTVIENIASFESHPSKYKHWKLAVEGQVATLSMNVKEDGGLRADDYVLKLNLSRLAPAVRREIGEHEVRMEKRRIERQALRRDERQQCVGDLGP